MNLSLLDPFQGDFPEIIDGCLDYGASKCISFNRRGTLLAAGCAKGVCVIWDLDTRGIANILKDEQTTATITSVNWSKNGKQLLSSSADNSISLWDVCNGRRMKIMHFDVSVLYVRLSPSANSLLCLISCAKNPPLLFDFDTNRQTVLPVQYSHNELDNVSATVSHNSNRHNRAIDTSLSSSSSSMAATFDKSGELIYTGGLQGEILILSVASCTILSTVSVPGGTLGLRQLIFSRNGRYLIANCHDRVLRVFENLLPIKRAEEAAMDLIEKEKENSSDSVKSIPSSNPFLKFLLDYYDGVNRFMWRNACFNGDGEYVIASAASKGEHKIYIWNRNFGQLARILDGPKDAVIDLTWHPTRSLVASVGHSGRIYLWCKLYVENWNAFAPDYKELEDNEEYVEREDEFDNMSTEEGEEGEEGEGGEGKRKEKDEMVKKEDIENEDKNKLIKKEDENEEIDIETVEKITAYSDSDDSQTGLHFIPVIPEPDPVLKLPPNLTHNPPPNLPPNLALNASPGSHRLSASKLSPNLNPSLGLNSNALNSKTARLLPVSDSDSKPKPEVRNEVNGFDSESEHANYAKMFLPDEQNNSDNSNGRGKRKRKISEKALEFQLDFYRSSNKNASKLFDKNEENSNLNLNLNVESSGIVLHNDDGDKLCDQSQSQSQSQNQVDDSNVDVNIDDDVDIDFD